MASPPTSGAPSRVRGAAFPRTKFHHPPGRPEHVRRARLLERIARGGARTLLVSAPPGFGKSTLLGQWAAGRPRVAWVSLDADDRGGRLWSAVLAALQPLLGEALDPALEASAAPVADLRDDVLVALLDVLDATEEPLTLVLDDLHLVLDDERTRASLDWVLGRLPAHHAVAMGTRRGPELAALGRQRIRGELLDVGSDELRFDPEECGRFLRDGLALRLDDAAIAALDERVEGWPAALYLAALRLRLGEPLAQLLARLDGRDEELLGGLADEVLAAWPTAHRRFIRETALLDRFTADLSVHVLGGDEDEARAAFRELTRTSLLLTPLDGARTWFRCHHLLRDVLRQRLEEEDAARARELHVRAGAWLESEGGESELYEALEHYLAARAWDAAAELLARHGLRMVGFGALGDRARGWLGRFPAAVVRADARLAYVSALAAAVDGDRHGRDAWIATGAATGWAGPMPDGTASYALATGALAAMACFDDLGTAVDAARRALEQLPPAAPARAAIEALGAWHALLRGERERAARWAERALAAEHPPAVGLPLAGAVGRAVLALLALDQGDVDGAEGLVVAAEDARQAGPLPGAPHGLPVVCARARLERSGGRPRAAIGACRAALERTAGWRDSSLMVPALLLELARAQAADGDRDGALRSVRAGEERLRDAIDAGTLPADLAAVREGQRAARREHGPPDPAALSGRELDVLRALSGTGSLRDVADGLLVSRNTVKTHTRSLYAKLGVASRQDAVRRGRELGLLGGVRASASVATLPVEERTR
ncbi:LuxR C-terminal-related transcriptional regulator [Patulibacter defluvii]|uniref:LuxR C-terminal-related transcriptional regulator n=1 Tax=Patulibacter defluvii TaxID=3095358 RepID=UPI002A75E593|nr:LuxR C-terminal-related transcriptional regulator [Patulibacter sp. DM4]